MLRSGEADEGDTEDGGELGRDGGGELGGDDGGELGGEGGGVLGGDGGRDSSPIFSGLSSFPSSLPDDIESSS